MYKSAQRYRGFQPSCGVTSDWSYCADIESRSGNGNGARKERGGGGGGDRPAAHHWQADQKSDREGALDGECGWRQEAESWGRSSDGSGMLAGDSAHDAGDGWGTSCLRRSMPEMFRQRMDGTRVRRAIYVYEQLTLLAWCCPYCGRCGECDYRWRTIGLRRRCKERQARRCGPRTAQDVRCANGAKERLEVNAGLASTCSTRSQRRTRVVRGSGWRTTTTTTPFAVRWWLSLLPVVLSGCPNFRAPRLRRPRRPMARRRVVLACFSVPKREAG